MFLTSCNQDAYILGRLLTDPALTTDNVAAVLQIYDDIRRPVASDVVERSLRLGFLYEFHPDYLPNGVDVDKLCGGDLHELRTW